MRKLVYALGLAAAACGCMSVNKPGYDTLIAHRGESKDAPENTVPAYKMAVDRGFGFECDIYLSSDKRLYTFHDSTLRWSAMKTRFSCSPPGMTFTKSSSSSKA